VNTAEHKPYTRREIIIIVTVIVVAALIIGNFNSTTTVISSVSSGVVSISLNVVCNGFGEPTYYNTMDVDINYTTYEYGHCYFGFWVSNGQQAPSSIPNIPSL